MENFLFCTVDGIWKKKRADPINVTLKRNAPFKDYKVVIKYSFCKKMTSKLNAILSS